MLSQNNNLPSPHRGGGASAIGAMGEIPNGLVEFSVAYALRKGHADEIGGTVAKTSIVETSEPLGAMTMAESEVSGRRPPSHLNSQSVSQWSAGEAVASKSRKGLFGC